MIPPPLTFFAQIEVEVAEPLSICVTSEGHRRMVPILGGTIRGPTISATILTAGEDTQLIKPDGYTRLDARYVARIDGGGSLFIFNTGVRYGAPGVMAKMARGESVDPEDVYFRTTPRFETDVAEHEWLTKPLFIGVGARHPRRVNLTVFSVG
jgi:hypothetical protein